MDAFRKLCVIFLMAIVATALASPTLEMGTHGLSAIGTVEGKTYFLERDIMIWEAAKQRCQEGKMRMATIKTSMQHEFLQSKHDLIGDDEYWIGARDALSHSQYVWDGNNGSLNTNFINYNFARIRSCLSFKAISNADSVLNSYSCTSEHNVLCEIVHNKNM